MHGIDEHIFEKYENEYDSNLSEEDKDYLLAQYGPTWRKALNIKNDSKIDFFLEYLNNDIANLKKLQKKYELELREYQGNHQIITNSIKETSRKILELEEQREFYIWSRR